MDLVTAAGITAAAAITTDRAALDDISRGAGESGCEVQDPMNRMGWHGAGIGHITERCSHGAEGMDHAVTRDGWMDRWMNRRMNGGT